MRRNCVFFRLSCETHEGWALRAHDVTLKTLSINHSRVGIYLVTQHIDKKNNNMKLCNRCTERETSLITHITLIAVVLLTY